MSCGRTPSPRPAARRRNSALRMGGSCPPSVWTQRCGTHGVVLTLHAGEVPNLGLVPVPPAEHLQVPDAGAEPPGDLCHRLRGRRHRLQRFLTALGNTLHRTTQQQLVLLGLPPPEMGVLPKDQLPKVGRTSAHFESGPTGAPAPPAAGGARPTRLRAGGTTHNRPHHFF